MGGAILTAEVDEYLGALLDRLGAEHTRGVYAVGSLALGAYEPGRSDIDVLAVLDQRLGEAELRELAGRCGHRELPCPAPKLELVVLDAAAAAGGRPDWQLNLNTGAGVEEHVGLDPAAEPSHWFVLDMALAREHGITLAGPPAPELIGAPVRAEVRRAQAEAVAWYAHHEPGPGAVLAACRAWHWEETGRFVSKRDALSWAMGRLGSRP